MDGFDDAVRHVVVFDCNIYLDAARIIGAPFSWEAFDRAVARLARLPVPHPTDKAFDSLRAMAACTSGRFAGEEVLEVWNQQPHRHHCPGQGVAVGRP